MSHSVSHQETLLEDIKNNTTNINTDGLESLQTLTNTKLDTLDNTLSNGGIYQAQVHIRDINLPQINTTMSGVKEMTQSTRDACIHLRDVNLPQIHTDINNLKTSNEGKLDILEASNQLNKGFLEQIEGHIETMSENQSTFQSGDNVVVSGVSTSSNQSTTHGKLDILETSNQLIKNNGLRSWGAIQTIEGNLIVTASSTHSGSSSFATIPTKPMIVYVKCHGAITDWFAFLEGSIDNSVWVNLTTDLGIINGQGLRDTPQQQNSVYVNNPPYPYLRVRITNANGADRGFEIKVIQTN